MYDCPEVAAEHKERSSLGRNPLSCSKARYYNPNIGRFISEDMKRFDAGFNFYKHPLNDLVKFTDPYGFEGIGRTSGITDCPTCRERQIDVQNGFDDVCKKKKDGNCRATLAKYQLLTCFIQKCNRIVTPKFPVVCINPGEDCGGCGGPCNNISNAGSAVFLQPKAFSSICGPLSDTMAHEMGHMCGIGPDSCSSATCEENKKKANEVGAACSVS